MSGTTALRGATTVSGTAAMSGQMTVTGGATFSTAPVSFNSGVTTNAAFTAADTATFQQATTFNGGMTVPTGQSITLGSGGSLGHIAGDTDTITVTTGSLTATGYVRAQQVVAPQVTASTNLIALDQASFPTAELKVASIASGNGTDPVTISAPVALAQGATIAGDVVVSGQATFNDTATIVGNMYVENIYKLATSHGIVVHDTATFEKLVDVKERVNVRGELEAWNVVMSYLKFRPSEPMVADATGEPGFMWFDAYNDGYRLSYKNEDVYYLDRSPI